MDLSHWWGSDGESDAGDLESACAADRDARVQVTEDIDAGSSCPGQYGTRQLRGRDVRLGLR